MLRSGPGGGFVRSRLGFGLSVMIFVLAGCGGVTRQTSSSGSGGTGTAGPPNVVPVPATIQVEHVALVVLENHSASQVLGNPAMPFFNTLATQHALAANYFGNTHPSIGNYFMLTTGTVVSNDDNFVGVVSGDNLARALTGAGRSWKAYMESLPGAGYLGGDVYPYAKHHNPFSYFSDVLDSGAEAARIVPLGQLFADLGSGSFPAFALIIPNKENDAHDCPGNAPTCADSAKLAAADGWLRANIGPLIGSREFANTVLIITFDEGSDTDLANGGGQVATVLLGARVKSGFRSGTFYQHQSTLRLILDLLKVGDHPGASAGAPSMGEFFQ
jgi:phosphatidylinositol-3-phosphatase